MSGRDVRVTAIAVAVIAVLCALPPFLSSTWLLIMFLSFLWLVMTANYDVLDGFLGYINLGQGAFFGLGAYVATIALNAPAVQQLGPLTPVVITAAALLVAALFAAIMAFPLFRLKGLYFAIGTLILIFLLQVLALNLEPLTGGSYGMYVPPAFFMSTLVGYYLALALAVVSLGFNFYLSRSALGLAFRCIKEDEDAANGIGVNLMKYKILALVLCSLPTAAAGVLFALNSGFIDPNIALGVERSLLPPLMALLGGTGTVLGPVFGTAIIRIIETVFFHYLRLPVPSMLFFGLTLLAVALIVPEGLLKSARVKRLGLLPLVLVVLLLPGCIGATSDGASDQIPITVSKPDGAGPFPAVVVMHDCSGLGPRSSGAPGRWTKELVGRGYVVVIPDSFTPRGHPAGVCTVPVVERRADVSPERRAHDAYVALAYARALPYVDGRRVGIMGGSHGGSTTLATMIAPERNSEPLAREKRAGFVAAVALYPSCAPRLAARGIGRTGVYKPVAPVLILIGEKDDWTPAEPCQKLTEGARQAGYPVAIKVYPGAHHSFDSSNPVRYVPTRINANSPSGRGATTGGDPSAWADSIREVVAFFGQHLGRAGN